MKFDHKIRVRNKREQDLLDMIEEAATLLATELDLHEFVDSVRVERQTGWGGVDTFYAGKWIPSKKMVKVNLRNMTGASYERVLTVLCHEMRHAYQWKTEMFAGIRRKFRGTHSDRYLDLPWEIDAREYAEVYVESMADRFNLSKKVSGDTMKVWDADSQRAVIATKHKVETHEVLFQINRKLQNSIELPVKYVILKDLPKKFKKWTGAARSMARSGEYTRTSKRKMSTVTKLSIGGY
jgi:hypothetical protein